MRHVRDLFGEKTRIEPIDRNREGRAQIAIVDYLDWVAPHIFFFHPANGGWRTPTEAARFKAMGVKPGVADLVLILPAGRSAFWEVKAGAGRSSEAQKAFQASVEELGHRYAVVRSIDDARRELARLGVETRETAHSLEKAGG